MAKRTIVKEAVGVVRTVAEAALDAAAVEARRVIAQTVANTAARVEDRAKEALPQLEGAVEKRLVKPVDRMLKARGGSRRAVKKKTPARRRTTATKAARAAAKTAAARRTAKKAARKTTSRKAARKKRGQPPRPAAAGLR